MTSEWRLDSFEMMLKRYTWAYKRAIELFSIFFFCSYFIDSQRAYRRPCKLGRVQSSHQGEGSKVWWVKQCWVLPSSGSRWTDWSWLSIWPQRGKLRQFLLEFLFRLKTFFNRILHELPSMHDVLSAWHWRQLHPIYWYTIQLQSRQIYFY